MFVFIVSNWAIINLIKMRQVILYVQNSQKLDTCDSYFPSMGVEYVPFH